MIVSLAVVAYNEKKALPRLLDDILLQTYPHGMMEILLIDSASTDSTKKLMEKFAAREHDFLKVSVLDNPKRNIPSGHNVAIKNYIGDALIRIDAHASIPADFIEKNVNVLKSGEYASGGRRPNITDMTTDWKQTLLIAEQSMFGSGIAPYRNSKRKQYSSSLFCGMYKREVYDRVGLYNELLPRSEDNEMTYRMRQAGFKLCYSPDIVFYQQSRSNLRRMIKQKYANGYWVGKTLGICKGCFQLFHFVPFAFVLSLIASIVSAVFGFVLPLIALSSVYLLFVLTISIREFLRKKKKTNIALPVIFFLLHASYGIGTLIGLIELPFWMSKIKKDK